MKEASEPGHEDRRLLDARDMAGVGDRSRTGRPGSARPSSAPGPAASSRPARRRGRASARRSSRRARYGRRRAPPRRSRRSRRRGWRTSMLRQSGEERRLASRRKAGVNQRSRMPSAMLSMPSRSTAAMRWFQNSAVPILWAVSQSTRQRTRSGRRAASCCAIRPPIERPQTITSVAPTWSISAFEIVGVIGDGAGGRAEVRQPVAPLVVEENREVGREVVGDRVPDPQVGAERVDEHDRRASALGPPVAEVKGDPTSFDELQDSCPPRVQRRLL